MSVTSSTYPIWVGNKGKKTNQMLQGQLSNGAGIFFQACQVIILECYRILLFMLVLVHSRPGQDLACSVTALPQLLKCFTPAEPFRKFPGLRELELPLNGLRNLKITPGEFKHLEVS